MKIMHKLIAMIMLLACLSWGVGLYSVTAARKVLQRSVQADSERMAEVILNDVDHAIERCCIDWQVYSAGPLVQNAIEASNGWFARQPDLQAYIDRQDREWSAAPGDRPTPLMKALTGGQLSDDLRRRLAALDRQAGYRVYGEAFVTNRYGTVVALSSRTTDYRQDDEDWWQQAWNHGLFVSDVSHDASSDVYSVDICTRVEDYDGNPVGVVKTILNIRSVIAVLQNRVGDSHVRTRKGDHFHDLLLLTSDRRIIYSSRNPSAGLADPAAYRADFGRSDADHGCTFERNDPEHGRILGAYAFSRGYGDYRGLGWITVVEQCEAEVFAPASAVQTSILTASALIGTSGLLLGLVFSLSLSRRIARLRNTAGALGRGDLTARSKDTAADEIGQLAACFNHMARELEQSSATLQQHAETLAQQVEERTLQLQAEIVERERAQHELARTQKLESVGQLAAGIAHEINTPAQFVADNTRFLRDAFKGLDVLIAQVTRLIDAAKQDAITEELIAEVDSARIEADIDYTMKEVPKAIQQSLEGIECVGNIVLAMKEFSHPGSKQKQPVDLNRAIQTTLIVCRNEWKYAAEMVTDFDPDLPPVPCLAGDLNQVVLNLVVNAAHAVAEQNSDRKGTILVQTRRDGDWAEIRIQDSGPGIPEDIRDRVFDHFFTTKEVGKGTGQGLTIAHSIVVKKHGGTIHFETEMGQGTTFIVRLPITHPANSAPAIRDSSSACPSA
ncbi:MAG: HAMP domain-containing protein [Planctomycetaceae bacterium]|nr:HAMP domain-containing protein [Planctomycetaceae bacterium]